MSTQSKKFIGADQIDQLKILLDNASYLRAKNFSGSPTNIIRLNASNIIEFFSQPQFGGSSLATESFVTTTAGNFLPLAGGTMSGAIAMGNNKITGLTSGTGSGEALQWGQIGAANGIAGLDGAGKVPVAQLPNSIMEFQGVWNALTNSPTLADGVGNIGDVYRVNVAGTQDLGSGSQTFVVGDWVMLDASLIWQKAHAGADSVLSVNGASGVVTVNAINQLTGDATAGPASGSQSQTITFATVNGDVGSFGSSTSIPSFTVNAKGLVTAASSNVVIAPAGTLTGTTLAANVVSSSLTSVATITSGTWQGSAIAATFGGTGQTTYATGDTLYASATNTLSKLTIGANGTVMQVASGIPSWVTAVSLGTASATASTLVARDANSNFVTNAISQNVATQATTNGTLTLTVSSAMLQQFTGTTAGQIVVFPNATTLTNGRPFWISNRSTQSVTVNANGGGLLVAVPASSQVLFTLISNGTAAGTWDFSGGTVSISNLTAALGSNTIDNLNRVQTWNWSTIDSQAGGLVVNVNAITSGTGVRIASSGQTGGVGSLLQLATTGGASNSLVNLDIQNASTENGKGLNISLTGGGTNPRTAMSISHAGGNSFGLDISMTGTTAGQGARINIAGTSASNNTGLTVNANGATGNSTAILASAASASATTVGGSFTMTSGSAAGTALFATHTGSSATGITIQAVHAGSGGFAGDFAGTGAGTKNVMRVRNTIAAANNSAAQIQFATNITGTSDQSIAGIAGMVTDITAGTFKGALIFSTSNGAAPAERMRLDNVGNAIFTGHLRSTGTAPTPTVNANAGTGATTSVANATDTAGILNLTTTAVAPAAGAQVSVAFATAFATAPIVTITARNADTANFAVASGVYVTTTTTTMVINFANTDAVGHAYSWFYHVVETQ